MLWRSFIIYPKYYLSRSSRQSASTHSALNVPWLQQLAISRRYIQSPNAFWALLLYKPFMYGYEIGHFDQPFLSKLSHQSALWQEAFALNHSREKLVFHLNLNNIEESLNNLGIILIDVTNWFNSTAADNNQWHRQLDNWGSYSYIFVFCIMNFFWNSFDVQNTDISICLPHLLSRRRHW